MGRFWRWRGRDFAHAGRIFPVGCAWFFRSYVPDAAVLRLQQILFYREMGLELTHIKEILDSPDFDLVEALRSHRVVLQAKDKTELQRSLQAFVDSKGKANTPLSSLNISPASTKESLNNLSEKNS